MIHSYEYSKKNIKDIGEVKSQTDAFVHIKGFESGVIGEAVGFETGEKGIIFGFDGETTEVLVFSRQPIVVGTMAARTGEPLKVSVGDEILGDVVSSLGYYLRPKKEASPDSEPRIIDVSPLGVDKRSKIKDFMETGVPVVDLLIPIGKGQRELVVGDRRTGKTHFLLQTVTNQAKKGTICVYAMIGKRKTEVKRLEQYLTKQGVMKNSVIIASTAYDPVGEIYLTPFTAMAVAEHFRDEGKDVLVVLDDLSTHANYYREMLLTAKRFPGRESYPADIFHVHSRILERSGCFNVNDKKVSITCLPVAEAQDGDLTGYIQTNLMSMTDGHLFFDRDLFFNGVRPAINIFLSVTRVGRQTHDAETKKMGEKAMSILTEYEDAQRFVRFGPEMTEKVKDKLERGRNLLNYLQSGGVDTVSFTEAKIAISKIL